MTSRQVDRPASARPATATLRRDIAHLHATAAAEPGLRHPPWMHGALATVLFSDSAQRARERLQQAGDIPAPAAPVEVRVPLVRVRQGLSGIVYLDHSGEEEVIVDGQLEAEEKERLAAEAERRAVEALSPRTLASSVDFGDDRHGLSSRFTHDDYFPVSGATVRSYSSRIDLPAAGAAPSARWAGAAVSAESARATLAAEPAGATPRRPQSALPTLAEPHAAATAPGVAVSGPRLGGKLASLRQVAAAATTAAGAPVAPPTMHATEGRVGGPLASAAAAAGAAAGAPAAAPAPALNRPASAMAAATHAALTLSPLRPQTASAALLPQSRIVHALPAAGAAFSTAVAARAPTASTSTLPPAPVTVVPIAAVSAPLAAGRPTRPTHSPVLPARSEPAVEPPRPAVDSTSPRTAMLSSSVAGGRSVHLKDLSPMGEVKSTRFTGGGSTSTAAAGTRHGMPRFPLAPSHQRYLESMEDEVEGA